MHPRPWPRLAGALGERRGLLAGDDRRRDRRPRLRRRHRRSATATPRAPSAGSASPTTGSAACDGWTLTRTGPLSAEPYYLRLTVDGTARRGHDVHDRRRRPDDRPARRRRPELPRARAARGQGAPTTPGSARRCRSSTASSASTTPNGQFWHRYNHDGYGETLAGGPFPGDGNTGRLWPIFAGERGEYELAAGESGDAAARAAAARLERSPRPRTRADAARAGVGRPAAGRRPGYAPGTGTLSATPLGWTHAQFVRLAWSIDAGRPVERPAIVACRYAYADACSENSSE